MLLDHTFENKDQCKSGGHHPQRGLHRGGNTKRAGIAPALLKILDVKAEWRRYEYTRDIDSADNTMELRETIAGW